MEPDDRHLKIKERITEILQHIPEDVLERLMETWLSDIDELLRDNPQLLRHILKQMEKSDTDQDFDCSTK